MSSYESLPVIHLNDLVEHRKAAHDALEQLGLHVIWMEAFGARPVESTKACLEEVEESDLFVGIYSHRKHVMGSHHKS